MIITTHNQEMILYNFNPIKTISNSSFKNFNRIPLNNSINYSDESITYGASIST